MTTTLSIGDTLTNTEWVRTMALATDPIAAEAYNKLLDLVNNEGYPLDDVRDFIDTYGTKAFVDGHYETWADLTDSSYNLEAIEAFVEEFGVENINSFEDAYCGSYRDGAHFAQELVTDQMSSMAAANIPDFVEINWEATWDNLSQDYTEIDGHIFHLSW